MERRSALIALCGIAAVTLHSARAQTGRKAVIGILYGASNAEWPNRLGAFRSGLAESGYAEGRNVELEIRLLEGQQDRASEAASDLVQRKVDVIVATGGPHVAVAAKSATATIPIVVTFGGDPVKSGLVASLNRPGGNITGVAILAVELGAKLLDVLQEIVPKAESVALLVNPESPTAGAYAGVASDAARSRGLRLQVLRTTTVEDIDAAFTTVAEQRIDGLLVAADPFFEIRRDQLIALARRHRIPTFYFVREFVAHGGLASYGTDFNEVVRMVGAYAGRILKGAKPADLPVLEPTKFELVINAKTAKALDLTIPQSLLLRADEVVQ